MAQPIGKVPVAKQKATKNLPATVESAAPPAPPPPVPTPDAAGVRKPILAGAVIIFVFFGIFGTWAALAPLNSAAIAAGVVNVESNRKTVQHLEGGIVGKILVREGDKVKAGQVLIRLDETQPRASLDLLKGRYIAAKALEDRLRAERDGKQEIRFSDELMVHFGENQVAEILNSQINIFEARKKALQGQTRIIRQRVAQFREEIKGLREQIKSDNAQLRLIDQETRDVGYLVGKGLAPKPRLLALQRKTAEIGGNRGQNLAQIARAEQSIGESLLQISELKTTMNNEVVQELREVQTELFELAERISAAEDVLKRTEIRAPLEGTVVGLQVHTPGGVISPGVPLMDIVPRFDKLVIEAQVDPLDIDIVHPGLPAQVRLTAFSQRNILPLDGKVVWVSADRLTDENTGLAYYSARIQILGDISKALGGAALYPGMQAEVMIVTGERTPLEYLWRPISSSLNRAFRED